MRAANKSTATKVLRQNSGYIFALCVFFVFLQAGLFAGHRHNQLASYPDVSSDAGKGWIPDKLRFRSSASTEPFREHPIPRLMDEAEDKFRRKLARQSKTLRAAVTEYKRRYKRDPPKGFDEWWRFAREHDVKMVDEYDGLVEDLAPFWTLSGQELRRRALQVIRLS